MESWKQEEMIVSASDGGFVDCASLQVSVPTFYSPAAFP